MDTCPSPWRWPGGLSLLLKPPSQTIFNFGGWDFPRTQWLGCAGARREQAQKDQPTHTTQNILG